jgi:septin family protein
VTLRLKIVQMPLFAESLDRRPSIRCIQDYLTDQYQHRLIVETAHKEKDRDSRIHLLLYFLSPSSTFHIKTLDGLALKELTKYCNVLPLIAKADTFTPREMYLFKQHLLQDFDELGIFDSPFPWSDAEKDIHYFPFSVMGSDHIVESQRQWMRGRQYPWGTSQVENPNHCDFVAFREIVIVYFS